MNRLTPIALLLLALAAGVLGAEDPPSTELAYNGSRRSSKSAPPPDPPPPYPPPPYGSWPPNEGGYSDTARWQRDQALWSYGMQVNRLGFMTSRLEAGKNPRAFQVAEQIRVLLEQAKAHIDAERYREANGVLYMTNGLFAELSRLAMEVVSPDPDRPASSQNALAEAAAMHARLQDHLYRLRDRPGPGSNDERTRQLLAKVQELLDKCKESLAARKAEAAKELCLKAEAMLPELHQAIAGSGKPAVDPARARIEERIQRAADLARRRQAEGGDADRLAMAGSLLEQARTAAAAGKLESAEDLTRHAEQIVAEPGPAAGGRLSSSAFDRLQGKLDRAGAIVKGSGSEKASRILEKSLEHFGKAERFRSEGQKARAEAEMDIALKLAAKAVDIARAAGR